MNRIVLLMGVALFSFSANAESVQDRSSWESVQGRTMKMVYSDCQDDCPELKTKIPFDQILTARQRIDWGMCPKSAYQVFFDGEYYYMYNVLKGKAKSDEIIRQRSIKKISQDELEKMAKLLMAS